MNPHADATNATTPFVFWRHHVLVAAGVSHEQAEPQRERLALWYRSGEPVSMAADGLKQFVRGAERAAREDRTTVRAALLAGLRLK